MWREELLDTSYILYTKYTYIGLHQYIPKWEDNRQIITPYTVEITDLRYFSSKGFFNMNNMNLATMSHACNM